MCQLLSRFAHSCFFYPNVKAKSRFHAFSSYSTSSSLPAPSADPKQSRDGKSPFECVKCVSRDPRTDFPRCLHRHEKTSYVPAAACSTARQKRAVHSSRASVSYTGRNAMSQSCISSIAPSRPSCWKAAFQRALIDIGSRGKLPPSVAKSCTRPAETQRDGGRVGVRWWEGWSEGVE